MIKKEKLIFVAPILNSFIKKDYQILKQEFKVVKNIYSWHQKILTPVFLIRQFFYFLFITPSCSCILIEFGGYWSLIPSIFGKIYNKPTFIVIHGTDGCSIPSINYGSYRKKILAIFCEYSFKYAHRLLPVSDSLMKIKNTYSDIKSEELQGVLNHFPSIKTPYTTLYNGLDINTWKVDKVVKEEASFITVFTNTQFLRKGGDLILSIAKKNRHCKFYMAGMTRPNHIEDISANVIFLGKLNPEELKTYYKKSRFNLQLAVFEGFGLALCEGMLSQCIPIGSSVNAIPQIIGDTGYILKTKDINKLQLLINKALSDKNKDERGKRAQERIKSLYPLEKRQKKLIEIIKVAI